MKEHIGEIVTGVVGIAAAAGAWFMGGRQAAKGAAKDTLTKGADQIVDSSNKLLQNLEKWLDMERNRAEDERKHKESCEKALNEHKQMIDKLSRKLTALEKQIKG
jgi:peptidoglycan hydrolase CwlO-like protein